MENTNQNIIRDDEAQLSSVMETAKHKLSSSELGRINRITTALRNYALGDIKKVSASDNVLATFILCSCFIEQMATYRYGTDNVGSSHFKNFVDEYLSEYDGYNLKGSSQQTRSQLLSGRELRPYDEK